MKIVYPLLLILFLSPLNSWSLTVSESEISTWESKALEELKKHKDKDPQKEFLLYMIAGRELSAYGQEERARRYYLKAFAHPSKSDKTEAVIQLVALNRENKKELIKAVDRAHKWFRKHPDKNKPELKRWLEMMEGYAQGKTPYLEQGYYTFWAVDARINELMKEGKAEEAYQLLGPVDLNSADINQRVRQDLLASVSLGKKVSPPLSCLPTLEKYPNSTTWSMRVCRFLDDWKNEKKPRETVKSIKDQLENENPERLHWIKLLERL